MSIAGLGAVVKFGARGGVFSLPVGGAFDDPSDGAVRQSRERRTWMSVAVAGRAARWPLRLRDGVVEELALTVDLPFGLNPAGSFHIQNLSLHPGDRIVFLTDGMFERNAAALE